MADLTIGKDATDLFSLGSNFEAQNSSTTVENTYAVIDDEKGDNCTESGALDITTRYSATYRYCGAGVDLGADLDTALLTAFGSVKNSKLVETVSISFTAGEFPEITVTGHNHASNPHDTGLATFVGTGIVTTSNEGVTVEDFLAIGSGDSCVTSATIDFSLEHVDKMCGDGTHAVGANMNGRVDVTLDYLGTVTGSPAGWVVDSSAASDQSKDFDTASVTAHKFLTRTV